MKDTRAFAIALIGLLTASTGVLAGEIYGKVMEGAGPVPEGTAVEVRCGDKTAAAKTDKTGSYHLVAESGKCSLSVKHKGMAASLDVASYDDPVQVDLVVEVKDGKLAVRRK